MHNHMATPLISIFTAFYYKILELLPLFHVNSTIFMNNALYANSDIYVNSDVYMNNTPTLKKYNQWL